MDNFPRRNQLDKLELVELAIKNSIYEVEKLSADERLTNAIIKLTEAFDLVADYIDSK